jgi:hypothetical protein
MGDRYNGRNRARKVMRAAVLTIAWALSTTPASAESPVENAAALVAAVRDGSEGATIVLSAPANSNWMRRSNPKPE